MAWALNADQRGGGTTLNNKPSYTVAQAAAQIDRDGALWTSTQATHLTYSYLASASTMPSGLSGFTQFNATQIAQTELALNTWEDVANVVFTRVGSSTYNNFGQITFGNFSSSTTGGAGVTTYSGTGANQKASVWLSSSLSYELTPTYLGYGRQTLVHEIGHTLGLDHPGNYDASVGTPTYSTSAVYYEDSRQYSVMSYWSETNTGGDFKGSYAAAPLLDDIAAIQRLYGANMSTRVTDTVYGWNSNTGLDYYTATNLNPTLIFAAWDAGGKDTFDFSGYNVNQLIDLNQGAFSNVGGLTGNVTIAMGAVIENAIGGGANDTIIGNAANNVLTGNGGDDTFKPGGGRDTIDGGTGNDTLILSNARSGYTTYLDSGNYYIMGAKDGVLLSNVETVTFADSSTSWSTLQSGAVAFNGLSYIAANPDLIKAFGTNAAAGAAHFVTNGFLEGRSISFDGLRYIASNADLIKAFGTDSTAATAHYVNFGFAEGRSTISFDPYNYIASNPDLIKALGADATKGDAHYILFGANEHRITNGFNTIGYLASNADLLKAFGSDLTKAEQHYITNGFDENRSTTSFDALKYIASYGDLIKAFGEDVTAATSHYVFSGYGEGRSLTFNPLLYAASSIDLAKSIGTDQVAAEKNYIESGYAAGRPISGFDSVAYLLSNPDLLAAHLTADQALVHWLAYGADEGRVGDSLFGREQTNHILTLNSSVTDRFETANDKDWFQVNLSIGQKVSFSEFVSALTNLQVYDDHGTLLTQVSTPSQTLTGFVTAQYTGVYYVEMSGTAAGSYRVSVSTVSSEPLADSATSAPLEVTHSDIAALMNLPATPVAALDFPTTATTADASTLPVVDHSNHVQVLAIGFADSDFHHSFDLAHHALA